MKHNDKAITLAVAIIVCLALVAAAGMYSEGLFAQSTVTLENPGFEGEYTSRPGEAEVKLPDGWEHWWDRDNTARPEYLEGDVTHTGKAVKQFTTYNDVDGGVQQEVYGVTPGQWYEFSIWAHYRSTPAGNKMAAMACINPWGDNRVTYRTTVCGKEITDSAGEWVQVSVIAQAWSDKITVSGRFVAEWPFDYNDVFWDDATIAQVTIGACPTPAPCPTAEQGTVVPLPTGVPGDCATVAQIEELFKTFTWGIR